MRVHQKERELEKSFKRKKKYFEETLCFRSLYVDSCGRSTGCVKLMSQEPNPKVIGRRYMYKNCWIEVLEEEIWSIGSIHMTWTKPKKMGKINYRKQIKQRSLNHGSHCFYIPLNTLKVLTIRWVYIYNLIYWLTSCHKYHQKPILDLQISLQLLNHKISE